MPKNSQLSSSSRKKSRKSNTGNSSEPSHPTKKKLITFLQKSAQLERKLEIIKQMLCEQPQFTPHSLFHRFDSANKRYLTEKDIEDFLIDSKVSYKGSELKTLFGRIDTNRSGTISLRQWQNFILPNQNPRLRYQTIRRPVFVPRPHEKLTQKIQWIVAKFFREIFQEYMKLADFNTALINSFDFNADQIFDMLSFGEDCITGQTIQRFMDQSAEQMTKEQIGCLIKLIDKKGEAKLYRQDFKSFMATMGLKKQHQIFDELSPIPALKDFTTQYIDKAIKQRQKTLKQRYKDNKSYVKGMDLEGHHILGYSRYMEQKPIYGNDSYNKSWLSNSGKKRV